MKKLIEKRLKAKLNNREVDVCVSFRSIGFLVTTQLYHRLELMLEDMFSEGEETFNEDLELVSDINHIESAGDFMHVHNKWFTEHQVAL